MSILKNAVDEGKLTHTEAHFIYKHADDTFLQRVTRSLSWNDIPKIMEKATPEEMIELKDIFKIKAKNAFEKAKKDPEEQAAIMKQVVSTMRRFQ